MLERKMIRLRRTQQKLNSSTAAGHTKIILNLKPVLFILHSACVAFVLLLGFAETIIYSECDKTILIPVGRAERKSFPVTHHATFQKPERIIEVHGDRCTT